MFSHDQELSKYQRVGSFNVGVDAYPQSYVNSSIVLSDPPIMKNTSVRKARFNMLQAGEGDYPWAYGLYWIAIRVPANTPLHITCRSSFGIPGVKVFNRRYGFCYADSTSPFYSGDDSPAIPDLWSQYVGSFPLMGEGENEYYGMRPLYAVNWPVCHFSVPPSYPGIVLIQMNGAPGLRTYQNPFDPGSSLDEISIYSQRKLTVKYNIPDCLYFSSYGSTFPRGVDPFPFYGWCNFRHYPFNLEGEPMSRSPGVHYFHGSSDYIDTCSLFSSTPNDSSLSIGVILPTGSIPPDGTTQAQLIAMDYPNITPEFITGWEGDDNHVAFSGVPFLFADGAVNALDGAYIPQEISSSQYANNQERLNYPGDLTGLIGHAGVRLSPMDEGLLILPDPQT